MFRRNNPVSGLQNSDSNTQSNELPLRPAQASSPAPQQPQANNIQPLATRPAAASSNAQASKPADLPVSRFGGIPGVMARRVGGAPDSAPEQQGLRKLIVGREISLSGDITACDILVVEGNIEATLRDGKHVEITEAGHFKGSAEVEEADIAGKFEGSLTVRGRLKLRSTGQIEGTLSYGEIEVEAGGRLVGELKVLPNNTRQISNSDSVRVVAGAEV